MKRTFGLRLNDFLPLRDAKRRLLQASASEADLTPPIGWFKDDSAETAGTQLGGPALGTHLAVLELNGAMVDVPAVDTTTDEAQP